MIQLVAFGGCGVLIVAASSFTPTINEGRKSLNMYGVESVTESAPPEYAFAIQAFGAFRGLIANIAFIRAEEYKRAGRYYDAMQLHSWICKLQPRFPSVWEYCSWNMAWNISVTTYTPQERWNWVYNGAKLIRDEGLRYNPRAVNLYRQLAWIFVNKMSETTDEHHMTYKRNWAWRMHLVLGRPPDPLGEYRPDQPFEALDKGIGDDLLAEVARREKQWRAERDRTQDPNLPQKWEDPNIALDPVLDEQRPLEYEIVKKAAYDRIKAIADAPQKLDELYETYPETREMVAQLRELGVRIRDEKLSEDDYWREEGLAFTFFVPYRQLDDPVSLLAHIRKEGSGSAATEEARMLQRFDQVVGVREKRPAGQALLRFLQRKVLLEVYKLDPRKMAELTAIFGPMDWRVVDAHSLYWVNEGLIAGQETISKFGNDKINAARLIFFSLRNLQERNRLVFEPYYEDINYSYLNFNYDLNFIESMHRAYLAYGKLLDPDPQEGGVGGTFRTGHQNFLTDAIRLLYFAGREREAAKYFQYLRDNYSRTVDGRFNPTFAKPLARYVMDSFLENIDGYSETRDAISVLLMSSFNELRQGNLARHNLLVKKALDLHSKYNEGRMTEQRDKMQLPPFRDYQADVLRAWFRQPAISPTVTVNKARLWVYLPLYLKHAVYDELHELFARECAARAFEVRRAFPEPPGMQQSRERTGRRGPDKREDGVETPAQQIG
ncbi:MAG: hypothetical protein ACE5I3_04070 [Phycisphaerae bacterium]